MRETPSPFHEIDYDLRRDEIWWRDRVQMLLKHGYRLRPRLQPGWTPSWLNTDKDPNWCEDSLYSPYATKVIDAVRLSDNRDVAIQKIKKKSEEAKIIKYITAAKRIARGDYDDHHIVPILDSFEDESEPDLIFFVSPLLREFNFPSFKAVSEIVHLFKQLLEGLVYLHSLDIAHRDCSLGNIMMDAPSVFPRGLHACHPGRDRTGENPIKMIPRYKVFGPVNYYFIDFDISILFELGEDRLAYGDDGADGDVPEFLSSGGYDPFPADVFILGNLLKKHFIPGHKNLEFLAPLIDSMTAFKPSDRPTAKQALLRFKKIKSRQGFFSLRRRLIKDNAEPSSVSNISENVGIVWRTGLFAIGAAGCRGISSCAQCVRVVRGLARSTFSTKS